jgi:hypothetical protein
MSTKLLVLKHSYKTRGALSYYISWPLWAVGFALRLTVLTRTQKWGMCVFLDLWKSGSAPIIACTFLGKSCH